jgi:hypothetical protein
MVEHHAVDARANLGDVLGFAQVRAIDLRIVLEFARLPEARVELLGALVAMVVTVVVRVVATVRVQDVRPSLVNTTATSRRPCRAARFD